MAASMRIPTNERLLGVLGYFLFFFIIPLKVKRESMFVQFHSRQGGVLFAFWAIVSLILFIILMFVDSIDIASTIVIGLIFLVTGYYLLMMLVGMFKVALGERYRMPLIADLALMLKL